jgi:hypothetical protein
VAGSLALRAVQQLLTDLRYLSGPLDVVVAARHGLSDGGQEGGGVTITNACAAATHVRAEGQIWPSQVEVTQSSLCHGNP